MAEWHTLEIQDAVRQIHSDSDNGLTAAEAARRLAEYGPNELVERAGKSAWSILLEQFTGIMVVILIISAVIFRDPGGDDRCDRHHDHRGIKCRDGIIQGEDPAPFNPFSCKYAGGEERGVHPEVCRWHAARNDKNCHECIRFAVIRNSVLERK